MNSKKTWMIIGTIAFIVLVIIIIAIISEKKKAPNVQINIPAQTGTPTTNVEPTDVIPDAEVVDAFRTEAPTDIRVPEVGEKLTEAEAKIIAVPTVVTAAAPGVTAQFRSFDIKAENNQFMPLKIIGRIGDTIHVNFTAVDKNYDIVFPSYNMKQTAKQGETKILEFQAVQDGSFVYYCEMCGGVDGKTKGNIIITK
jgi:plastocyanin